MIDLRAVALVAVLAAGCAADPPTAPDAGPATTALAATSPYDVDRTRAVFQLGTPCGSLCGE